MEIHRHLKNLDEQGYTMLDSVISDAECDSYKNMLEHDYRKYSPMYHGTKISSDSVLANKTGEKIVFNLHNKNIGWYELFGQTNVISILDVVLKHGSYRNNEPYYLNNIQARCPIAGYPGQQLHLDSNLPGVNYTLISNVIWLLDDFTEDNGATKVVPGSHKWLSFAPDGETHPDEIFLTGKKGSVIIFNANLWHGGGENNTGESRWAVILGYARWFIKPSFDPMKNMPAEIFNKLSDADKSLLGYRLLPPKDEFTRLRRQSEFFETPDIYKLPE